MAFVATDALKELSKDLNIQFDAEVAIAGDQDNFSDVKTWVPSSSYMLNKILGGGTPLGRVIEIYGEPSHGKSTIVQHMMNGFQQYPGISILIDAESAWHRARAMRMGHDPNRHLHIQSDTVEQSFSVIDSTIRRIRMKGSKFPSTMPVGIFWDTISASQTEGEKDGDIFKDGMADKPRKIRSGLRRLSLILPATNCALVFVNQTITNIKAKNPAFAKTTPGGSALKFWASKRLEVARISRIHYPYDNAGIITCVKSVKDKIDSPNREVQLPILHLTGIHPAYELLNYLVDNSDYVNVSRKRYVIIDYPSTGQQLAFHQDKAGEYFERYPDLKEYLECCADEIWEESLTSKGKKKRNA